MKLTIDVTAAELLLTSGVDELFLHVDLPSPFPANGPTMLQINCAANTGQAWCEKVVGITPKVINIRTSLNERKT